MDDYIEGYQDSGSLLFFNTPICDDLVDYSIGIETEISQDIVIHIKGSVDI